VAHVQRENATKTNFESELAAMTSSHGVKNVLRSRADDVTELEVTSSRRCVENAEQVSMDNFQHHHQHHQHHHHQQQQQPTSTQYISDRCVLLTYFTGDIDSNVDQHFARALSQPSSFGPDYHGTTPPSVHTGMPTHSATLRDRDQFVEFQTPI